MKILIVLFILLTSCSQSDIKKDNSKKVIAVYQDNILIRKDYLDSKNLLLGFVTYVDDIVPQDSIAFLYNDKNVFIGLNEFQLENGNAKKLDFSPNQKYYENIFNSVEECKTLYSLKSSFLLLKELNDLCTIQNSVLSNGQEVSNLMTKSQEGNLIVFTFNEINSRFSNLSEEIQSYFYNKTLLSFKMKLQDNQLIQEEYIFENGKFLRTYSYGESLKEKRLRIDFDNKQKEIVTVYKQN